MRLPTLGLLSVTAILLSACISSRIRDDLAEHDLRYQVSALAAAKVTLEHGSSPEKWDAAAFVSDDVFKQIVHSLNALQADIKTIDGAKIRIQDAAVHLRTGRAELKLTVAITIASQSVELSAPFEAYLHYLRTELAGTPARPEAVFNIRIRPQNISFSWGPVSANVPNSTAEWLFAKLEKEKPYKPFLQGIELRVPLAVGGDLPFGGETREKVVRDNGGKTTTTLAITTPQSILALPVSMQPPVFTRAGAWFFAVRSSAPTALRASESSLDRQVMEARRKALLLEIDSMLTNIQVPKDDITLWLNSSLFESLIEQLGRLPKDKRRITIRSVAASGSLAEKYNEFLNQKGGYSVALASNTAVSGYIQLQPPASVWTPGTGLIVQIPVTTEVAARLRTRLDLYIGGDAVNDTFDLDGKAEGVIEASLVTDIVEAGDYKAIAFGAVMNCTSIPYELTAGGEIKWGARMKASLGGSTIKPGILFTSAPIYFQIAEANDSDRIIRYTDRWVETTLQPSKVAASTFGYVFAANFFAHAVAAAPTDSERGAISDKVQKEVVMKWNARHAQKCDEDSGFVFLFDGHDFGPNNEFVKIVTKLYEAGHRTLKNIKDVGKQIERVVKKPDDLDEVVVETGKKAEAEAERFVNRIKRIGRKLDPSNW